jgi:hypothetical protein
MVDYNTLAAGKAGAAAGSKRQYWALPPKTRG